MRSPVRDHTVSPCMHRTTMARRSCVSNTGPTSTTSLTHFVRSQSPNSLSRFRARRQSFGHTSKIRGQALSSRAQASGYSRPSTTIECCYRRSVFLAAAIGCPAKRKAIEQDASARFAIIETPTGPGILHVDVVFDLGCLVSVLHGFTCHGFAKRH